MPIATRLTNTGTLLVNGIFDENTFSPSLIADALVIGGGGAGGSIGGGGAGGHQYFTNQSLVANTNYTVTVGAGGTASAGATGNQGSNSVFDTYTSAGGGGGAGEAALPAAGGSGGGGGGVVGTSRPGAAGNTPSTSPSQGNTGGNGNDNGAGTAFAGGGGGGAGGTGDNASGTTTAGNGGLGTPNSITGSSVTRAAGGGGGAYQLGSTATAGTGGSSIGGNGGRNGLNATGGLVNTGSGGGGNGYTSAGNLQGSSGAGGSGVVIIKYPNIFTISNSGGGLTFTTDSSSVAGYNITTFTAGTGQISFIAPPKFRTTPNTVYAGLLDEVSLAAGAVSFNGTTQYLSTSNATGFNFGTGNFTVECWFFCTTAPGAAAYSTLITTAWPNDSQGIYLGLFGTNQIGWLLGNGTWFVSRRPATTYSTNTWNHLALVRVGTTYTLYLNGTSIDSVTNATTLTYSNNTLYLGGRTIQYFTGYMSNARVVKGTAVYTANFTPPQAILPAITDTQLLLNVTDTANFIKDNGPNNLTVTNNGSATFTANGPFNKGSTTLKQRLLNDGTQEVSTQFDEFTGAPVVDSSLQLWLDAGQTTSYPGSGSTWTDLSGKGNNGTLVNSPSFISTDGGGCIQLDGTNDHITLPITGFAPASLTIDYWIKRISDEGYFWVIDNSDQPELRMLFTSSGKLQIYFYDDGGYFSTALSSTTFSTGSWYNITVTLTNGSQNVYINRNQEILTTTGTYTGNSSGNAGEHTLGTYNRPSTGYGGYANVRIGSYRFYNRVLTADEIITNFNALRNRYGI